MKASLTFFAFLLVLCTPFAIHAQSLNEVKDQIEDHNAKIEAIEAEIRKYEAELAEVAKEKQTLQGAVKSLDVTRSATESKIKSTQNKIESALLELKKLDYEISDTQSVIEIHRATLAQSIRDRYDLEEVTFIELLMTSGSMADVWEAIDQRQFVEEALNDNIRSLKETTQTLSTQKVSVDKTKNTLASQKTELSTQKQALDITRQEKQILLTQTANEEAQYQQLIATKKAEQATFESEISKLEDTLEGLVDQSRLPSPGSGVLSWPFSTTFMNGCTAKKAYLGNVYCITQYFGNTPFATKNPQVYNGGGHSGLDFGAPVGTPLLSVSSGTVLDTGNTDAIRGCYSFGKWVVVKHNNGLSSLYAHLSSISVSKGDVVAAGQLVGYSGMTGYATGPHLHLGVYASEALKIMNLGSFTGQVTGCSAAKIPVAPKNAYLNPMSYF